MSNREIAVAINNSNKNVNAYETIDAIVSAGFKNVFIQWYNKEWNPTQEEQLKYVREKGLNIIFAHLGYKNMRDIWVDCENGENLVENFINDIKICKDNGISLVVMHLIGGIDVPPYNELGLKRLKKIIEYAEALDVNIAFENTKQKEYLYYVLDNFDNKNVGICFDSGHYHIFSNDEFNFEKYKDRIFAIHLHDNDKSDDLHLLPFEGTSNWEDIIKNLSKANYDGPITMEICYRYNYLEMGINKFYEKAYEVGKQLQSMFSVLDESRESPLCSNEIDLSSPHDSVKSLKFKPPISGKL